MGVCDMTNEVGHTEYVKSELDLSDAGMVALAKAAAACDKTATVAIVHEYCGRHGIQKSIAEHRPTIAAKLTAIIAQASPAEPAAAPPVSAKPSSPMQVEPLYPEEHEPIEPACNFLEKPPSAAEQVENVQRAVAALRASTAHPDLTAARRHVELLTASPDTQVCVRFIHDSDRTAPGVKITGTIAALWPTIEQGQAAGYGVFVIPNEGGNRDEDISTIRACFIDADGIPQPDTWHVKPDFVIVRDKTHWHAYWRMVDLPVSKFREAQLRLAAHYGTDTKVCNPSRVMRLAGTLHLKDPKLRHLVIIDDAAEVWDGGRRAHDLLAGLPEVTVKTHDAPDRKATREPAPDDGRYDTPANIGTARARIKSDLERHGRPVMGQHSDDRAYALAAVLRRDLGLSQNQVVDLLAEWAPLFDHAWLAEKAANSGRYGQNTAGIDARQPPEEIFKDFIEGQAAKAKDAARIEDVPMSSLLMRNVGPVQEIIPGLVEKGLTTFLSAPGGTHKSRLAMQWGICIGTVTPIFGRQVMRSTFVYLSCEDHPDEVTRRTQAIVRCLNLVRPLAPADARYLNMKGRDAPLAKITDNGVEPQPFWQTFEDYLLGIPGHKFVVIDSTYDMLDFTGAAKINEPSVKKAINQLDRLCAETDSTILTLWHPSQAGQDRGDASGWSVAWHNAPRARLSLTADKGTEGVYELKVEKRNNGPKGDPITLHWTAGTLQPHGEVPDEKKRFFEACIKVAEHAAEGGQAIQMQKVPADWVFGEIEARAGFKPTNRQLKEELAKALSLGRLRYRKGTGGHGGAGYYPFEPAVSTEQFKYMSPELRERMQREPAEDADAATRQSAAPLVEPNTKNAR